ncbi:hypothetical protein GCM10010387_16160 [Streptomyces inusitatus]|uniref:Uncharacterized protein n=1 Tax=Streptomyces inusitatus TaxID=68221 RepID=A0A918UN48_9ACTN|nr:hypothetical protein GCM10010387_16160 [Streptomyces inusitatus]
MTALGPRPDGRPDIRTESGTDPDAAPDTAQPSGCNPAPTSPDTVRTCLDTDAADIPDGVRIEYRARVPRHLAGAAFAEALNLIAREKGAHQPDKD